MHSDSRIIILFYSWRLALRKDHKKFKHWYCLSVVTVSWGFYQLQSYPSTGVYPRLFLGRCGLRKNWGWGLPPRKLITFNQFVSTCSIMFILLKKTCLSWIFFFRIAFFGGREGICCNPFIPPGTKVGQCPFDLPWIYLNFKTLFSI